jgi:hypothetical protein
MTSPASQPTAPLTDAVAAALAKLVDDAQSTKRQPSHSEIQDQLLRAGLLHADPGQDPRPVGKAKRVRAVLQWAIENDIEKGRTSRLSFDKRSFEALEVFEKVRQISSGLNRSKTFVTRSRVKASISRRLARFCR